MDTKCSKCKLNKNEGMVGCEAACDNWFHYSCLGLTNAEFGMLSKNKNLFYMCDNCKRNCDILDKRSLNDNSTLNDIKEHISEVTDIVTKKLSIQLKEIDKAFIKFKNDMLNKMSEHIEATVTGHIKDFAAKTVEYGPSTSKPSYAATVRSKSSLIVTPKVIQNPTVTKSDMLQNINPVSNNINLTKVRPVRDGGLLVSCQTDNECEKFKETVTQKLSDKYTVKEVPSLNPRIKVVGFSEKLDDDMLLNYIKTQNKHVFSDQCNCKIISNVNLKKNKNLYQAVIQIDRITYSNIMDQGKLFVGYDYCSVFDAIELRRCFKCCGFHHLQKNCTSKIDICPRCAQPHKVSDCKSDVLYCINCHNFKKSKDCNINIDVNHACWDKSCHVYNITLEKFKNSILGTQ